MTTMKGDEVTPATEVVSRRQARNRRRALELLHTVGPDEEPDTGLDPLDELDVALYTISDFGQWIQNADTKSGMLGALLGLMLAGVTSQLDLVGRTLGPQRHAPVAALFAVFVVSLFVAGTCRGLTQLPRLTVPTAVRRLAFPAVAGRRASAPGRPDAVELRDEAWRQAETLAGIAMRKFRYLRVGLLSSGLCVVTFLTWLAVSATARG